MNGEPVVRDARLAAMSPHAGRRAALFLPLILLAGCAGATIAPSAGPSGTPGATPTTPPSSPVGTSAPPTATPSPSPSPSGGGGRPTGPSDLILRVSSGGGLAGPGPAGLAIPAFSLFGDGRFILQGATPMIFPGPALPALIEQRLTPDGVDLVMAAARSAGLTGADRWFDFPTIADASTTEFIVVDAEGRHTISVYALHEAAGVEGQLPDADRAARAAMMRFESQLFDLSSVLGPDNVSDGRPYLPTAMRIFASKPRGPVDAGLPPQFLEWPLGDLATFGEPWPSAGADTRCGAVEGADLEAAMPLFRQATQITRWTSRDVAYQLTLRPLLPDESGCVAEAGIGR